MAKETKQNPNSDGTLPETKETGQAETPVEETRSSTPPEKITKEEEVSAEDRANQKQFIDEFDNDDENFEVEGTPVKTAEALPSAQSEEVGDETETEAEVKASKQVPPVKEKEAEVKVEEKTPAPQPEKKTPAEEAVVVTPEQAQERFVAWRKETEDLLANHHYKFDQAQLEEMDADPGKFVSKVAARVYLDAVTAVTSKIVENLPRMVREINAQANVSDQSEGQFYDRWPKLKEHSDTVLRTGAVYRSLNPTASMEDFINEVGAQVMVALRIPPDQVTPAPNGTVEKRPAFKPAGTSPAGGSPLTQPTNIFSQLADEFSEELEDQ